MTLSIHDLSFSPYQQRESIKRLEERGLVETCRKGLPAKKYFKIHNEPSVGDKAKLSANKNKFNQKPSVGFVNHSPKSKIEGKTLHIMVYYYLLV